MKSKKVFLFLGFLTISASLIFFYRKDEKTISAEELMKEINESDKLTQKEILFINSNLDSEIIEISLRKPKNILNIESTEIYDVSITMKYNFLSEIDIQSIRSKRDFLTNELFSKVLEDSTKHLLRGISTNVFFKSKLLNKKLDFKKYFPKEELEK